VCVCSYVCVCVCVCTYVVCYCGNVPLSLIWQVLRLISAPSSYLLNTPQVATTAFWNLTIR